MKTVFAPPVVEGPQLRLRPVRPEDAAYIHSLRVHPALNRYLSAVIGTVEDQCIWIERYMLREEAGMEIYYIVERLDSRRPCGTVRLYDIDVDAFTWGSWILDNNKTWKAALESAVLSFRVGFNSLEKNLARVRVRVANKRANAFYRRLGMIETARTTSDISYIYLRSRYDADLSVYLQTLVTAKSEV